MSENITITVDGTATSGGVVQIQNLQDDGETGMPDKNCEACVNPTIATVLDQGFVKFSQMLDHSSVRHNSTAEFITEHSKLGFMLERQLIGAKAAGQLDRDSLAKSRLDVASVSGPAG